MAANFSRLASSATAAFRLLSLRDTATAPATASASLSLASGSPVRRSANASTYVRPQRHLQKVSTEATPPPAPATPSSTSQNSRHNASPFLKSSRPETPSRTGTTAGGPGGGTPAARPLRIYGQPSAAYIRQPAADTAATTDCTSGRAVATPHPDSTSRTHHAPTSETQHPSGSRQNRPIQ